MNRRSVRMVSLVTVAIAAGWLLWHRAAVEWVMRDFHSDQPGRAEDMLMDPLILHAGLVKDRVIADVASPAMPLRRYAIGFLGVCRISEALPVLRTILSDESEKDLFRGDALESIYQIAREEGLTLARQHRSRGDFLGYIARAMADGTHTPNGRTFEMAQRGQHD